MPVYEFSCDECGRRFDIVATFAEHDAGLKPVCPKCGAKKTRQVISRVTLLTSSKSEDDFGDEMGEEGMGDFGGAGEEAHVPRGALDGEGAGG